MRSDWVAGCVLGAALVGCREPAWVAGVRAEVTRLGERPLRRGAYTGVEVRFPESLAEREAFAQEVAQALRGALHIQEGGDGDRMPRVIQVEVRRFEPDAPPKSTVRRVGEGAAGGALAGAGAGLMVGGPLAPFTVPLGAGIGLLSGTAEGFVPGPKTRLQKRLGYLPYRVDVVVRVPPLPGTPHLGPPRAITLVHPGPEGPFMLVRPRSPLEPGLKPMDPQEAEQPGRVARRTLDALIQALVASLRQSSEEAGVPTPDPSPSGQADNAPP